MVIEGGKLTYHHLRNAVFTATGEPDGTFSDIPQVDRTLRGTSHYLIMRWMRRLARRSRTVPGSAAGNGFGGQENWRSGRRAG